MAKAELQKKLYDGIEKMPAVALGVGFSVAEILRDRPFVTPVELWARNERLVRALEFSGVPRESIGGAAADFEKLTAWLLALPKTVGATVAADLAADLGRLGISVPPSAEYGEALWRAACDTLAGENVTPRVLLSQNRASFVIVDVTEPPMTQPLGGGIYPLVSFDAIFRIESPEFSSRMAAFLRTTGGNIEDCATLERVVSTQLSRYAALGARALVVDVSGYSRFERPNPYHAGQAFARGMVGEGALLTVREIAIWRAQVLRILGFAAKESGLSIVWRVRPKTEHVLGDFSVHALEKLLFYLEERGALVPTMLSLAAGDLPRGLARLLGRFCRKDGTPLLCFGIEGAGAATAALARSFAFYAEHGALPLLLGITDSDVGHFAQPTRLRFARVVAGGLARFAATDGDGLFGEQALLSAARGVMGEQAAAFFGL